MIELFLDTTQAKIARVKIVDGTKTLAENQGSSPLETIQEALVTSKIKLEQIDMFSANPGPGSYTGIRIGLSIINALNFAFGKKVTQEEPKYQ